jgi:tetratricopeptide (TPR) repeat protein
MGAVKQGQDSMGQVYALAPECDATQLNMTAAEGYLLSRFDGATPWRVLREMGGIPSDEADACLSRWVEEGLLEVIRTAENSESSAATNATDTTSTSDKPSKTEAAEPVDAAEVPNDERLPPSIDETQLDEDLDLALPVQRRILEFEASLGLPYHELLAVPIGSEPKVVKRAYFKLSKEFHPDRYFRKDIGSHAARLEKIFKKVLEAHEMLSDPDLCQVENQCEQEPIEEPIVEPVVEAEPTSEVEATAIPAESKPRKLTKLERLRQRMPFKIDQSAIDARRLKAQEIFRAAEFSQKAGRLVEAEASIRIAISFDPSQVEFKEALGGLRIQAAGAKATKLLATPIGRMSDGDLRDAWKLIEDVLIYRPHDPELNERASRVCLQLGKLELAEEYAQTLIERTPEVAGSHILIGQIHREQGELDVAVSDFETALKLDEENLDAQRALASVRIGTRNQAQRGMA